MGELYDISSANALIDAGRILHLAGEEPVLRQLHRGNWIGGTTPYVLTREGGFAGGDKVLVTEMPAAVDNVVIRFVDIGRIPAISTEAPRNGFTIVIAPGMSEMHSIYALTAAAIPGIRDIPVFGWISGVRAEDRPRMTAKVFNGQTGEASETEMVVLQAALPPSKKAVIDIISLTQAGTGDEIVFTETSFSVKECLINGEPEDFYAYATRMGFSDMLPLVTELNGELINVSFKLFDAESRSVQFYAPVMRGRVYRLAASMPDYRPALRRAAEAHKYTPVLSCTCYHIFAYGGLEGAQQISFPGPVVFGELAHVLMNQTVVCLSLKDK